MTVDVLKSYEAMAKLSLNDEARECMLAGMNELEESFKKLADIDTTGVAPLISALDMKNVFREDAAKKFISRDELLSNAFEEYDGYFQVPKTLE